MMNSQIVDLRSDAVTLPSTLMRQAMASAPVGDDDFGEDPTINCLEKRAAALLAKESALFVSSGTMGNLVSILAQTRRGQAIAAGLHSHIYDHEYRGVQSLSGVSLRPVGETVLHGRLHWDMAAIRAMVAEPAHSRPTLLCLEQTINRLGGVVMPVEHMVELSQLAHAHDIRVHLDGARLFNAAVALGVPVTTLAEHADTVMIVFTKCLGAPVGGVAAGPSAIIDDTRRWRHCVGGGFKQGGVVAAACLAALDQTDSIIIDHRRAKALAHGLADLPGLRVEAENVVSNIVLVDVRPIGIDHQTLLNQLEQHGILTTRAMPGILRLVVHRDIDDHGIRQTIDAFALCTATNIK